MALDADTGKRRLGIQVQHLSERRAAAPRRLGVAGRRSRDRQHLRAERRRRRSIALSKDGKLLWERSIGEEFAAFTTHGGRTMSPLVDGDLVIVSAAISSWGTAANRAHRFVALDKRTGDIVYVVEPGRPPVRHRPTPRRSSRRSTAMRLLIAGLGDGGIHAIKPQTGEKVWSFVAAKRAINTGVVVNGNDRHRVARRREPRHATSWA